MGGIKQELIVILERLAHLEEYLEKGKAYLKEQDELLEELLASGFSEGELGGKRYSLRDNFTEANTRWKASKFSRWTLCIEELNKK